MLNCRKCDFLIKSNMRHALINNCCPSCGSAILGDTYTQRMKLFKQRLLSQEFSQNLSEDLIFDISLFMLMEFSSPEKSSDSDSAEEASTINDDSASQVDYSESDNDSKDLEYQKIRDEIRGEVMSESQSSGEELDEDLKIARLKRLAKESRVKLSGTSVRRLSND